MVPLFRWGIFAAGKSVQQGHRDNAIIAIRFQAGLGRRHSHNNKGRRECATPFE